LDADEADEHAAEPLDGEEPFFAEDLLDVGSGEEDKEGGDPGGECGRGDERRVMRLVGIHHDGSDGPGTRNERHGEGNNHRLAMECCCSSWGVLWENHGQGNQEKEDSPCDSDDGAGNAENHKYPIPAESKEEEDQEGDGELPTDDFHLPLVVELGQHGEEEGDLPRRVQDEENRGGDGEEPNFGGDARHRVTLIESGDFWQRVSYCHHYEKI